MESTTSKIITAKLAKVNAAKNSIAYQLVIDVINGKKELRPCYTIGSGKYTSNQNHTKATTELLFNLGIDYVLTNDSKRGGLTGNLITIKTKIK